MTRRLSFSQFFYGYRPRRIVSMATTQEEDLMKYTMLGHGLGSAAVTKTQDGWHEVRDGVNVFFDAGQPVCISADEGKPRGCRVRRAACVWLVEHYPGFDLDEWIRTADVLHGDEGGPEYTALVLRNPVRPTLSAGLESGVSL